MKHLHEEMLRIGTSACPASCSMCAATAQYCRMVAKACVNTSLIPGAVVIIPVLDNGDLLFERQYLGYPVGHAFFELPAGKMIRARIFWRRRSASYWRRPGMKRPNGAILD